uniref:antibiotic biosynthesis monooxygenase family protein n=1 Tax=uncultured Halomonas sp. TaxID=173971 RepID=UPI00261A96B7|nr:antibiotic biosynthesis monooxygenase [uncultured Halomonas sp.]
MYIAMNRFQVNPERVEEFEQMWLERETHLQGLPGFVEFHMLRGPEREDHVLYASHTVWRSREDFEAWTRSEAFRKAHAGAGQSKREGLYLGPPSFEGFEAIQTIDNEENDT